MAAMMPGAPGWEEYAFARGAGAYELRAEMLGLEGPEEYLEFQRLSELPPTIEEQRRTALEEAISTAYIGGYAIPEPQLGEDVYRYMEETPAVTYIPEVRELAEEFGMPIYTPPSVVTQPAFTYAEVPAGRPGPAGPTPYVAEAGFGIVSAVTGITAGVVALTGLAVAIGGLWDAIQGMFGDDTGLGNQAMVDLVNQMPFI